MQTRLVPLCFSTANERENKEFEEQLIRLAEIYSDVAEFLNPIFVGQDLPESADAVVFPQLIGAAFSEIEVLKVINRPVIVLTSKYGTVEMWDWEIVSYMRANGLNVFSPYSIELAKVILRAIAAKKTLAKGGKFLMLQDSPGEGMQANIFKRFYWWEEECTRIMQDTFGLQLIYRSWKAVGDRAKQISDDWAYKAAENWDIYMQDIPEENFLRAVKLYIAVKEVINEIGDVEGVGSNCLNESFNANTTPCLAWTMIFEKDNIICACEGDTLTLLSTFILYRSLKAPIMMTNIYPFLVGMAALAHEKIDKFPDIDDPDNHALGVHCGYFGLAPRPFCTKWCMRPKVLGIVDDNSIMVDCEFPKGDVMLTKIDSSLKKLTIIQAKIEDYVQYPGSDCRNGALIRYENGQRVMESLSSHHQLIVAGNKLSELIQLARVFNFETEII